MAIRVVIAEDEYLVREGIRRLLDPVENIEMIAAYPDADSVLAHLEDDDPDVVLTDLRMPPGLGDEGIELAVTLGLRAPDVGVLLLTQISSGEAAARIFANGAARRGYLLKERVADRAHLVHAISEIADGRSHVDPEIVVSLVAAQRNSLSRPSPVDQLSAREREVLSLVAQGQSNDAIAHRLDLSKRSVEGHINSIFLKLDIPDEREVSRRVAAALVFLAGESGR